MNKRHKPNHEQKEQLRKTKYKLPGLLCTVSTSWTTSGASLAVSSRRKNPID